MAFESFFFIPANSIQPATPTPLSTFLENQNGKSETLTASQQPCGPWSHGAWWA